MRKLIVLVVILLVFLGIWGSLEKYAPSLSQFFPKPPVTIQQPSQGVKIVSEESVVIDVVKKYGPSVVTVAEEITTSRQLPFRFGPFFFQTPDEEQTPEGPQNIGSGFIVASDGLIVTNKHVVSDASGKYFIITSNDKKYTVQKIYRDPLNDIAIIKINPDENSGQALQAVELGDSSRLQVGQFVIAIGTALGEFNNTVTTGVISGLGRGIVAGSRLEGSAEELSNVIQTDAAINPGNSGGPLINSAGQVIGVNVAVAQSGQNIGFALPINTIKDSLKNFNETGQFNRPYLGVAYRMISRDLSIQNDIPEGAYIQRVVKDSAADKAGIKVGDIITKIDGEKLEAGKAEIANIIAKKKVGDVLTLTIYREDDKGKGSTTDVKATLEPAPSQ